MKRLRIIPPVAGHAWRMGMRALSGAWPQWTFVGDGAGWSIDHDGVRTLEIMRRAGVFVDHVRMAALISSEILHFGSLHAYRTRRERRWVRTDHEVVTCFHGNFGLARDMDIKLRKVLDHADEIARLIVPNATMYERFIAWGFPSERLRQISVGVDVKNFAPATQESRRAARDRFGIPHDVVVIGSFQKDGNGWGEGLEPKLIKGPDVLCDVLIAAARELPVYALLTGPARGYVKQRLTAAGVGFTHHILATPDDLPLYYHACDCYLMCSREEGGPKAVPEAMASGIPLVASRTGLARDVETEFSGGWFANVDDVDTLLALTLDAVTNKVRRDEFRSAAPDYAVRFSWERVGEAHLQIYRELSV